MKHYLWIVLITVAVGIGSTALFAQHAEPTYSASATIMLAPSQSLQNPREIADSLTALDRRSVVATVSRLPTTRGVKSSVARALGITTQTLADFGIKSVVVPDTNIVEIEVSGPDRRMVAAIANATAQQMVAVGSQFYGLYSIRRLDAAVAPRAAGGPPLWRQIGAGALLGLLIGLAAAYLLGLRRRAILTEVEMN